MNILKKTITPIIFVLTQFFIYYYLFISQKIMILGNFSSYILCLVTVVNAYFFTKKIKLKDNIYFSKWYFIVLLVLINFVISFFIGGKQIFLNIYKTAIDFSMFNIFLMFLTNIFVFPYIYNILFFLDNFKYNVKISDKINKKKCIKMWLFLFVSITLIYSIICWGFYPGNMTSDSIDQWMQAINLRPIVNAHPPFYTILMRLISFVWKNPFVVILFNICFYAAIISSIMTYFYKQGINKKIIYIITACFVLSCNNLCLLTTLWKDIPFTISLLWLTFEIFRIVEEKDAYFKKIRNVALLILAMCCTYFFRVNGMFPYYVTILILIYYFFKLNTKRNICIAILGSIFLMFIIKYPVFNAFNVEGSNDSSGTLSFAAKGLGALIYYEADVSKNTKIISEKILPRDIYMKNYLPYNIDSYSFGPERWSGGLANVSTSDVINTYIYEAFNNPSVIIRDRLDSNNLLWSYMPPDDGFNTTYVDGIWFPQDFEPEIINLKINDINNNYYPPDNIINKPFRMYRTIIDNFSLTYCVTWRVGLSLSMFLIIGFWTIVNRRKNIPILLPTIINILFWVMLMSHQSYRYVWFIFVNTFFIYIFALLNSNKKL